MRIVCPGCDAEYDVRDELLRPGLAARCVRCAHQWVPVPAVEETEAARAPPAGPEPDAVPPPRAVAALPASAGPTAMERLAATSARPRASWGLRLAWVATWVLLAAAGFGLYNERAAVMASWPPSTRLYAVLGLADAPTKQGGTGHGDETRPNAEDRHH